MNSILFKNEQDSLTINETMPEFFSDLNLDQVIEWITAKKEAYHLPPYFYSPLKDVDAIVYRQEVFRDLENEGLRKGIQNFAEQMIIVRRYLGVAEKSYYDNHKLGWHLEAALVYSEAVSGLVKSLSQAKLTSRGFKRSLKQFESYLNSAGYVEFDQASQNLKSKLSSIDYNVVIDGNWVRVRKYDGEKDYSLEVKKFFAKFKESEVKDFRIDLAFPAGMNHIEAKILDLVAKLFPEPFDQLNQYFQKYEEFLCESICTFDREIQFYLSYLAFMDLVKTSELPFCYPHVDAEDKSIRAYGTFDIALAELHRKKRLPIVCNDFYLEGEERIIVVSGANQGGKTTFARMFGQIHYLASLGCPIPGQESKLFVFDQIYTHFEREEDIKNLRGKLKDDVVRLHQILKQATSKSIIIMNEIFTSTTLEDAIFLSQEILKKIIELDAIGVCVTFIDELSTMGKQTVSMVSTVDPDDPAVRTFKILRRPADGRAYAIHIAKIHRLTHDLIKKRIEK